MQMQMELMQKMMAKLEQQDSRSRSRSRSSTRKSRSRSPSTVDARVVSDGSTTPVINKTIVQVFFSPDWDLFTLSCAFEYF